MRILLITGKGGAGKTTVAAATALRLSERGLKTLAVSLDGAPCLAHALAAPVGAQPAEVAAGLSAVQLDAQQLLEDAWPDIRRHLAGLVGPAGTDQITADELTVLPGVEQVLTLVALSRYAAAGDWDVLVVDCPPSAQTLRLLALPEALGRYLAQSFPAPRLLARDARPLAALLTLHDELAAVRTLLTDPAVTSVHLVLTPEAAVLADTRRTVTALALYGYAVDTVVANRVVPPGRPGAGDDPWRAGWVAAQRAQLAEARAAFPAVRFREVAHHAVEPVGAPALRAVADELYGELSGELPDGDPAAPTADRQLLTVRPDGADFVLELALPLAEPADIRAGRVGDDLVVTLDGHRRVLALPSVLRRCAVAGGRLTDGVLRLRFRRDASLWRLDGPV